MRSLHEAGTCFLHVSRSGMVEVGRVTRQNRPHNMSRRSSHSSSLSSMGSSSISIGASPSSSVSSFCLLSDFVTSACSLSLLSPADASAGLAAEEALAGLAAPGAARVGGASEGGGCVGTWEVVVVPGGPAKMDCCAAGAWVWLVADSGCFQVLSSFARVSDLPVA